jgi:RNA polymerase subunit RPABC4/transcription elongation factor Spt4/TM2 domain-containing membrane protein YozV
VFCRNCGKELIGSPEICPNCGARPMRGNSFCSNCGAPTTPLTEVCVKCGARVVGREEAGLREVKGNKSVGVATCLAIFVGIFLMGFGQIYAGRVGKGLGFLVAGLFLDIVSTLLILSWSYLVGGILISIVSFAIWLWQIFDARESVREYNRRIYKE